jgi:ankyrin repeat protein
MKRLFDPSKPHLGIWLWIYDPELSWWRRTSRDGRSLTPRGTALHYAAVCGFHRIVDFLVIEHSQDIHSRAFDKALTALHVAVLRGHAEVVRILLKRGANPTAQDKHGRTPFHEASRQGHVELVRMILERGADPTVQDKDGRTPFHEASLEGHVEVVRMILERGADPTVQDKDGRTPFHLASLQGHVEVVRMILERGADPTVQDKDGRTPFHEASLQWTCGSGSDDSRAGRRSDSTGQGWPDTIPRGVATTDLWKWFG